MSSQEILKIEKMYYEDSMSATEIANELQIHRTTVQKWLKKNNPEKYYSFCSASGKKNKTENKNSEERFSLSKEWLGLYAKGYRLKEIAQKYGYTAVHVTNIMKKFHNKEMEALKKELKKQREENRRIVREDDIRTEANMKHNQSCHAREMSHKSILSSYTMFVMYIHLYERYQAGAYRIKRKELYCMPADMPKKFFVPIEKECQRFINIS